jgi:hypothetical protein
MILSCNNSKKYCKIDSKSIKENETEILNLAYESFFNSNSYINSQKMNPPMIFDQIYTRILNYDSNIKADDKLIREFKIDFEDLPIDVKELKSMFSNNIPIVEVAAHWVDPVSSSSNDGWIIQTFFFPNACFIQNQFNLGKTYRFKGQIPLTEYFPYYIGSYDFPISGQFYSENDSALLHKMVFNYNGEITNGKSVIEKIKGNTKRLEYIKKYGE